MVFLQQNYLVLLKILMKFMIFGVIYGMVDGHHTVSIKQGESQFRRISLADLHKIYVENPDNIEILTKDSFYTKLVSMKEGYPKGYYGWRNITFQNLSQMLITRDQKIFVDGKGAVRADELKVSDLAFKYYQDSVLMNDSMQVSYFLMEIASIEELPVVKRVKIPGYSIVTESGNYLVNNLLVSCQTD